MSKAKSSLLSKDAIKSPSKAPVGWDTAIKDAEGEIVEAKSRIQELRGAIRIFKHKLECGEPFGPEAGISAQ